MKRDVRIGRRRFSVTHRSLFFGYLFRQIEPMARSAPLTETHHFFTAFAPSAASEIHCAIHVGSISCENDEHLIFDAIHGTTQHGESLKSWNTTKPHGFGDTRARTNVFVS